MPDGLGSSFQMMLGQPVTQTPTEQMPPGYDPIAITDLPGGAAGRPRGVPIAGVVLHHTGGSTLEGAYAQSKTAGTGTNYYVARDGSVIRRVPEDQYAIHIREPHSRFRSGNNPDLTNANTVGIEVVAKNDADVTPAQRLAVQKLTDDLVTRNGIKPQNVVGHGELQGGPHGNREPDEGLFSARSYRNGIDVAKLDTQPPAAQPTAQQSADQRAQDVAHVENQAAPTIDRSQASNPETNTPEMKPVEHDPFTQVADALLQGLAKTPIPGSAPAAPTEAPAPENAPLPIRPAPPVASNPGLFAELAQSLQPQFVPVEHDPFAKA